MLPSGAARPPACRPPPCPPSDPASLGAVAVSAALARGFAAAGVVVASRAETWTLYRQWLDAENHGEMAWLKRDAEPRRDPSSILPWCSSILSVAHALPPGDRGNVARYARGDDYHRVVRARLKKVIDDLRPLFPPGTHFRVSVDTAPLLEREMALRAGVGFLGRNGMLIVPGIGSHVVLGELLTDVPLGLPTLVPEAADVLDFERCGDCRACLDSCPTGAFLAPPFLDARRCLSYLTIEKRGPLAPGEASALEGRLFGCDICQDVCPWNAGPRPIGGEEHLAPANLDPREVIALDAAGFRRRFFATALWRATFPGLVRNARLALALRPVR